MVLWDTCPGGDMVFPLASRRSESITEIAWVSGVRLWSWISNRYGRIVAMPVPFPVSVTIPVPSWLFYQFLTQLINNLHNSYIKVRRFGLVNMFNDWFRVWDCSISDWADLSNGTTRYLFCIDNFDHSNFMDVNIRILFLCPSPYAFRVLNFHGFHAFNWNRKAWAIHSI
jgi:hypothetical protein